jgi:hypothetical protein
MDQTLDRALRSCYRCRKILRGSLYGPIRSPTRSIPVVGEPSRRDTRRFVSFASSPGRHHLSAATLLFRMEMSSEHLQQRALALFYATLEVCAIRVPQLFDELEMPPQLRRFPFCDCSTGCRTCFHIRNCLNRHRCRYMRCSAIPLSCRIGK